MSGDKYPRVRQTNPFGTIFASFTREPARFETVPDGPFQVVPADAIVIGRDSLHPVAILADGSLAVTEDHGQRVVIDCGPHETPESLYTRAIGLVALAEYLREHPPVDEAEVNRVCTVLAATNGMSSLDHRARALVAKGVRVVQP